MVVFLYVILFYFIYVSSIFLNFYFVYLNVILLIYIKQASQKSIGALTAFHISNGCTLSSKKHERNSCAEENVVTNVERHKRKILYLYLLLYFETSKK